MVVADPGIQRGQACDSLVELRDVTATILSYADVKIPGYMDSRPLPSLSLTDQPPRDKIIGMLTDGWMNFDGEWKLAKYSTGESILYNLKDDPYEQRNLINDPNYTETCRRLDTELTQEIMDAMRFSMHDRLVHQGDMSQNPSFGREGWERLYPAPVDFVTG